MRIIAAEFGASVIASVNRDGIVFAVLSEEPSSASIGSSPVPRNERDIRRKIMTLHQRKELTKVDEPVTWFQERIIDHHTRIRLQWLPGRTCESPFHIHNEWQRRKEMFANVENPARQLGIEIHHFGGSGDENRHALIF